VESVQVIGNEFNLFLFLRDRMQKSVSAGMDADVAAVTIGVLTGDTSFMDWSFLQNVRYGGVAHLFAVSGLHVGVVYGLCFFLFNIKKLTHIPKIIRFLCMSALLLFYGGICGFSPSVIRAIVTCLCFYAFILVGFRRDMLEIIGVAGVATMAIQPVMIFNVGFQLSFAACLGIALMDRPLYRLFSRIELLFTRGIRTLFHRTDEWDSRPLMDRTIYTYRNLPPPIHERIRRNITSFFAATVAAQIGTLPIQLMTFGYVSGVGLLLNCIFVPIMSAVFGVLIAFVILATALPIVCAPVVLYVPFAVWSLLLLLFYATDYSAFSLSFVFPPIACVSYFATFLFWSDKLNLSKPVRAVISVAFAIVCVLTTVFANI
jgi:competence protein ComEC